MKPPTPPAVDREADLRPFRRRRKAVAVVHVHMAVNVCVEPTEFVPSGVIEMFASTTVSGSHAPSERVVRPVAEIVRPERVVPRHSRRLNVKPVASK